MQRNLATKIWAKWEYSLTAVRLKRDPPVVNCYNSHSLTIPVPALEIFCFFFIQKMSNFGYLFHCDVYSAGNSLYMCGVFHVFIIEESQVSYCICGVYHVISNLYHCITCSG